MYMQCGCRFVIPVAPCDMGTVVGKTVKRSPRWSGTSWKYISHDIRNNSARGLWKRSKECPEAVSAYSCLHRHHRIFRLPSARGRVNRRGQQNPRSLCWILYFRSLFRFSSMSAAFRFKASTSSNVMILWSFKDFRRARCLRSDSLSSEAYCKASSSSADASRIRETG